MEVKLSDVPACAVLHALQFPLNYTINNTQACRGDYVHGDYVYDSLMLAPIVLAAIQDSKHNYINWLLHVNEESIYHHISKFKACIPLRILHNYT